MAGRKRKSFPKKSKVDKRKGVPRKHNSVPDKIDLDNKHLDYLKLSKTLDENGRAKPLTENQLKQLIRNAVRLKWMSCPQKLAFFESRRRPNLDPNNRVMYQWQCEMCECWFKSGEVDVDHREGENKFTELGDAFRWASSILDVGGDTDLAILCSDKCHPIKTVMESHDFTYDEAVKFKKMTSWEDKNKIPTQKKFLIGKGFDEAEVSNKEKRRECYMKWVNK